eukprot:988853-Amphidinium_carterae.5
MAHYPVGSSQATQTSDVSNHCVWRKDGTIKTTSVKRIVETIGWESKVQKNQLDYLYLKGHKLSVHHHLDLNTEESNCMANNNTQDQS